MPTSHHVVPAFARSPRLKLDGADPLGAAVVRELSVDARQEFVLQDDAPQMAHLVLEGLGCRHRILADGRRQITAIQVPGDVCDLEAAMAGRADKGLMTLTRCILGEIPRARLDDVDGIDPGVRRALWRQTLRDQAIAREWLVGLGRRDARERLAHLLCETGWRLRRVGLGENDGFGLNLTQAEFADILGLSAVHVNRIMQQMRQEGLIEVGTKTVRVVSRERLERAAGFDPTYLDLP